MRIKKRNSREGKRRVFKYSNRTRLERDRTQKEMPKNDCVAGELQLNAGMDQSTR